MMIQMLIFWLFYYQNKGLCLRKKIKQPYRALSIGSELSISMRMGSLRKILKYNYLKKLIMKITKVKAMIIHLFSSKSSGYEMNYFFDE